MINHKQLQGNRAMGLLKDLYQSVNSFWTGFDFDNPLHSYIMLCDIEAIQKLAPKIKSKEIDVNGFNKGGIPVLPFCFFDAKSCENIQIRYEIAILFLDLGAKPYLPTLHQRNTNLHNAIEDRNIGTQRLLLWYDPDYEHVRDRTGLFTATQKLEQKGFEEYKKRIEDTAKDARAVKQLLTEAEHLKERLDFLEAIKKYNQAAVIFKKQGDIEKTLPYPDIYEESRPVLINFYRKKAFQCYQGVEECYAGLVHSPEIKKAHLDILKLLANEATALKLGAEAIVYAKKIAELTIGVKANQIDPIQHSAANLDKKNKDSKTKAEAEKKPDVDNEFTPLLALEKERRNQHKTSAANSCSDPQLRKRSVVLMNATNADKK